MEFLSVNEAASELQVSVGRIRQLLLKKSIAGRKLNDRAWAIPRSEIERRKEDMASRKAS